MRISTTELVSKILAFCELYSGIKFYPYQEQFARRVIRSVLEDDGAEITALFSRQSGKSETIATAVGGMMIILPKLANMPMFAGDKRLEKFRDGFWVGIFAPSQRQAQITYNRMRSRLQSKPAKLVLEDADFRLHFSTSNGQNVALTNGSFATAISASENTSIEGESFKFIIAEEAQDISNFKIRKSIHPMGAAYNATIAKIGTATTFVGDFYEAIERNKREYESGESKIRNHFQYDYKVVMKYNESYAKYIRREIIRLGEDSDEFRMSYALEWILERSMFVNMAKFEANNCRYDTGRVLNDTKKIHTVGIDVAKKNDSTVLTVVEVDWDNPVIIDKSNDVEVGDYKAYDTVVKDWLEINGDDYNEQFYEIVDFLKNFNVRRVFIDATAEASFADRLKSALDCEVYPYVFSSKSKSDMYKHLDIEIKAGRATIPADKETQETREYKKFTQQLEDLQKSYRGQTMVVSHPPERDAHDDYPDSWALAVFAAKDEGSSSKVETSDNNEFFKNIGTQVYSRVNRLTARRR